MPHALRAFSRLAPLALLLAFAACDSGTPPAEAPPVTPPVEPPPVIPPLPEAFSLAVTVRGASGAPVAGVPVALYFFPMGSARTAARSGGPVLSQVFPSPWQSSASVRFLTTEASTVRAELLDVLGARQRLLFDGDAPAGDFDFRLPGEDDAGQDLPGGAYVVRLIAGADTLRSYTIHTDPSVASDDFRGSNRALGLTDAGGQIRTTDRTAVPAFYVSNVPFDLTDDQGNLLGTARFGLNMEVVVGEPGSEPTRRAVTIRDGANTVEVRVD